MVISNEPEYYQAGAFGIRHENLLLVRPSCETEYGAFLRILNPFAPHMTEEIYQNIFGKILSEQSWPAYDDALCVEKTVEMAVQVNGKLRGRIRVPTDADAETVLNAVKADETVGAALVGKTVIKEIVVPNKIVNLVVK